VDFATSDAKVIAITMSEGHLEGRKLLIKDGTCSKLKQPLWACLTFGHLGDDYAGRPAVQASTDRPEGTTNTKFAKRVLGSQKQQPAPTLFLGNLSFETTDASIRQMFDAHRDPKGKAPLRDSVVEKAETSESADGAAAAEPSQPKEVWIRKVRLGTFEDSGNCKGWAFVDFGSIAAATAALTNPHNHNLDGRDIKVEYASADAVRRGGGAIPRAVRSDAPGGRGGKPLLGKGKYDKGTRTAARDGNTDTTGSPAERPAKRPRMEEQASTHDHDHERGHRNSFAPETNDTAAPARYEDARPAAPPRERRGKDGRMRPAPGAALAMAKRQSVAIVPSQATKIKF
jgi:RNA recognition motif-containing protein